METDPPRDAPIDDFKPWESGLARFLRKKIPR